MDGQRMDQIARTLASGMSRRSALKGVAGALGLSTAGALRSPTAAAPRWSQCVYLCQAGVDYYATRCRTNCRLDLHDQGSVCGLFNLTQFGAFSSRQECQAEPPPPPPD